MGPCRCFPSSTENSLIRIRLTGGSCVTLGPSPLSASVPTSVKWGCNGCVLCGRASAVRAQHSSRRRGPRPELQSPQKLRCVPSPACACAPAPSLGCSRGCLSLCPGLGSVQEALAGAEMPGTLGTRAFAGCRPRGDIRDGHPHSCFSQEPFLKTPPACVRPQGEHGKALRRLKLRIFSSFLPSWRPPLPWDLATCIF